MIIKTKTAEISYNKRGFLLIKLLNNNEVFDAKEAQVQIDAGFKLMNGQLAPVLVDVRNSFHVPNKEAKEILAENKYKTAEAILTDSLAQSVISNFYMRLAKKSGQCPIKIFRNEEKAIEWLLKKK